MCHHHDDAQGWDDIPADTKNPDASGADLTGYFKYATVKMDPAHVLNHGPVWKFFSDWRTAIPAAVTLTLPLWMYQVLPPLDERMLLAGIGISAGLVFIKAAGPLLASMKSAHRGARARALLEAEKNLNDGIADALETFKVRDAAAPHWSRVRIVMLLRLSCRVAAGSGSGCAPTPVSLRPSSLLVVVCRPAAASSSTSSR